MPDSQHKAGAFEFGKNWKRYLVGLSEDRIKTAEESLLTMLEMSTFAGKTFLDIGSGSGLFSLAARRLGARVLSFDCEASSVECTRELKSRFFPDDSSWRIERGSVLDLEYLRGLGQFDIVYAWGALHHTGAMWQALENTGELVARAGRLFIAIYNDQGRPSQYWTMVKRAYNRLPQWGKFVVLWPAALRLWGPTVVWDALRGRPFHSWMTYENDRGMSPWRDVVDWVGGYPFEVAKPEDILDCFRAKGFVLRKLKTCGGGLGCNEFVFERPDGVQR